MNAVVGFDHLDFLSLSFLLRIYEPQQDPASVSDEDEEPTDENDSITLRELSTAYSKERQLSKFLDSVAETFSREKSIPPAGGQQHIRRRGNTTGKGAGQVSASGLVLANQQPTVYIAKNEGTNDEDKKLANTLTVWIRAIATTGKRPAIEKDKVWTGLLSYYKQRLDVYAAQIESFAVAEITGAFAEGSNAVGRARELHSLSVEYRIDKSTEVLQRMVSIAYELRYEPNPATLSPSSRKGRDSICFLGRLKSAYKTFKETAIQFECHS
ncbi:putative sterigmatocystin biosynthesis protein stcT [Aspergillus udagawae]|nr:putative sterigmatocystin biosynthesis protein stcT [Aspergillus udagawae]